MPLQVPCPKCGAPVYLTDSQCLSCGLELDDGRPRDESPPAPPEPPAPLPVAEVAPVPVAWAPEVELGRPLTVTLVVIAAYLTLGLGLLWALASLLLLMSGAYGSPVASFAYGFGMAAVGVVPAIVVFAAARALWQGMTWARWLFIVLLAAVLGYAVVLAATGSPFGLPGVLLPVAPLAALLSPSAKAYCCN
jgi:hypothetical protein